MSIVIDTTYLQVQSTASKLIDIVTASQSHACRLKNALVSEHRAMRARRERLLTHVAEQYLPDMSSGTLKKLTTGDIRAFAGVSVQERLNHAWTLRGEWNIVDSLFNTFQYRKWLHYVNETLPRLRAELLCYLEHKLDSLDSLKPVRDLGLDLEWIQDRSDAADKYLTTTDAVVATLRDLVTHSYLTENGNELTRILSNLNIALHEYRVIERTASVYDDVALHTRNWIEKLPKSTHDWGAK